MTKTALLMVDVMNARIYVSMETSLSDMRPPKRYLSIPYSVKYDVLLVRFSKYVFFKKLNILLDNLGHIL